MVGPFIFFDQMGPALMQPGQGIDVRPHPHIGLSTVTWLFDGSIYHRDSLGSSQPISPGELNWMTAGKGIVHSERTAPPDLARERKVFKVANQRQQCALWHAVPARGGIEDLQIDQRRSDHVEGRVAQRLSGESDVGVFHMRDQDGEQDRRIDHERALAHGRTVVWRSVRRPSIARSI
jgi:redox-sensitive bicupin YhaK (pirin superfamily)